MANENYLDALDNMLGPLSDHGSAAQGSSAPEQHPSPPLDDAHQVTVTWAEVIEKASTGLQDSARNVQEAARKNIELGKQQHESIKDLVDAASGWRHTTRQAIQEVSAAKRQVIIFSIISAIFAMAATATTVSFIMQNRTGLANMANTILENVDDHQNLISRTLTTKIDELTSTLEVVEAKLDANPSSVKASPETVAANKSTVDHSEALSQVQEQLKTLTAMMEKQLAMPPAPVIANAAPSTTPATAVAAVSAIQPEDVAAEVTASTQPAFKAINDKMNTLSAQLTQFEQRWTQLETATQKQLQTMPSSIDEKLGARLNKQPATSSPTTVVSSGDNKAVLEQLSKLRAEMAELRQMQSSVKDQVGQIKQQREPVPYQYRNPDVERYPR